MLGLRVLEGEGLYEDLCVISRNMSYMVRTYPESLNEEASRATSKQ